MENDNLTQNNYVEIKDISIAAYLLSLNQVKLVGKRKTHSGILFQFFPKKDAEHLINLYWNLEAPHIQPKKLFSSLRDLKDMIFGG